MLLIDEAGKEIMVNDALDNFPDECCGFFLGLEQEGDRVIKEVRIVKNVKDGDKRRRFEISSKDYLNAEVFAEEHGLELLGVYHSHPNHPAIPSERDRVVAQPYFSYVILSVSEKKFLDIRSWRLNDSMQFEEEPIRVLNKIKI